MVVVYLKKVQIVLCRKYSQYFGFIESCRTKCFCRVEVQNARLGESYGDVTWTDQVYLTVAGHRVSVNSDYAVTINGTTVLPPILVQPYLFIDATTNHILVNTHLGKYWYLNYCCRSSTPGTWLFNAHY